MRLQDKPSLLQTVRDLKSVGINDASDRRSIIHSNHKREQLMSILEKYPEAQEELASILGMGDLILADLSKVMEEDLQDSSQLLQSLLNFFKENTPWNLEIYEKNGQSVTIFRGEKPERVIESLNSGNENTSVSETIVAPSDTDISFPIQGSASDQYISLRFKNSSQANKIRTFFSKTDLVRRIESKLAHMRAEYNDKLTGLYNRRYIEMAEERELPYSVLFIDLNEFKKYNDKYGHSKGDELLVDFAKILQRSVRSADKVCRISGDEFIILVHASNQEGIYFINQDEIDIIKQRIQENITEFNEANLQSSDPLGVSIGSALQDEYLPLRDIIKKADANMLGSKNDDGRMYREIERISSLPQSQQIMILTSILAMNAGVRKSLSWIFSAEDTP